MLIHRYFDDEQGGQSLGRKMSSERLGGEIWGVSPSQPQALMSRGGERNPRPLGQEISKPQPRPQSPPRPPLTLQCTADQSKSTVNERLGSRQATRQPMLSASQVVGLPRLLSKSLVLLLGSVRLPTSVVRFWLERALLPILYMFKTSC